MKKGKERKGHILICDYCRKEIKSSKSFTRFCSSKHRFYFFAKKKILLSHIQSIEAAEIDWFSTFLQEILRGKDIDKSQTLKFISDHKTKINKCVVLKYNAEQILIDIVPSLSKLTKQKLEKLTNTNMQPH